MPTSYRHMKKEKTIQFACIVFFCCKIMEVASHHPTNACHSECNEESCVFAIMEDMESAPTIANGIQLFTMQS